MAVNNLFGEDVGCKDGGIHCGLIGLQRRRTGLMQDEIANETSRFKDLCGAITS